MSPPDRPPLPLRLVTLGRLALVGADGEDRDLARRRRKLALLTLLALSPRPVGREVLVDVFWGEDDEPRARHSLADALSHLRRVLGRDAIAIRATEVALAPDARLTVDARELAAACAEGDWARAVSQYDGAFLDGVFIDRAPRFDEWATRERERLRRLFVRACEGACAALAAREDWDGCAALAQRWLDAAPVSGDAARALLGARAAAGTTEALRDALDVHARLVLRLAAEYDARPAPEVEAFAAGLAVRLAERQPVALGPLDSSGAPRVASGTPSDVPVVAPAALLAPPIASRVPPPPRRALRRLPPLVGAAVLVALAVVGALGLAARETPPARAWVVVADADNEARDSLYDGALTLALGSALAQSPAVDVLPASRVREVARRMRRPEGAPLDEAAAIEIAQRVGAGAVIVPGVARVGGRLLLTARLVRASTGELPNAVPPIIPRPAVATARAEAAGPADVLAAVDRLARQMRHALGESYLSVRGGVPLPVATTASLAALKAYADGDGAYVAQRPDDAERAWRLALGYDSAFALVHAQLGAHLAWTNRRAESERHFAAALRGVDRLPPRERLLVEAGIATWRGQSRRAIAMEEAWLAEHPADRVVLGRLAYAYLRARRHADARDAYERLLRADSTDAAAQLNLATALGALHTPADARRAVAAYGRAFALDPALLRGTTYLHEYAAALVLAGRADSAAGVYRAMLGRDAGARARGLRGLAFVSLARGRPADAAQEFGEAAQIHRAIGDNPLSEVRARLLRAAALDDAGATAAAAAERDTSLGLAMARPVEPLLLLHLGRVLARDGRITDARRVRDSLVARSRAGSEPDRAARYLLDAELAVADGRADEGERLAATAVRADSTSVGLEALAWAAWRRGDLATAAARYAALGRNREFGWEGAAGTWRAPYWLGLVEWARGDRAAARRAWAAFVALYPDPGSGGVALADARRRLAAP